MSDKVLVFVFKRPVEHPAFVEKDEDVRIEYAGIWVSFKDGKVIITSAEGES